MAAFHVAIAQPVRSCPEGQAVQSLQPNGAPVQCVPVEIRQSISESSIAGRYAFTGTQTCLASTFGFEENLRPRASTDPNLAAVVSPTTTYVAGFRTFNADGTGEVEFTAGQSVNWPTVFVTGSGFAGVGTSGSGPGAKPSGSVALATQAGTFTWAERDGKLFIEDSDAVGSFAAGPSVGCTFRTEAAPAMVAVLAKDRKTISMVNDGVAVESSTTTCPGAAPTTTPRICHRQRLLQKM